MILRIFKSIYHKVFNRGDASEKLALMKQREKENKFICEEENGVSKYAKKES